MSHSGGSHRQGRIHPHQRNADFSGNILGENLERDGSYVSNVQETEQHSIDYKTKRAHRNKIKQIYEFWKEKFPQYYDLGVRILTQEDLADTTKYWWKNKHDLVYPGLNSWYVKAFLSTKVKKLNGMTMSFDNIRKYFDAIQFGATQAGALLPVKFYQDKDQYLQAFRKQVAKAKGSGELEEMEADPIPIGLFVLICRWAVKQGNVMMWVWTVLQWNLLARSVNVEPLCFHHFKVFQDSIQVKYDSNKSDKSGENTTTKHLYANPTDPFVCCYLSFGIFLCLNASRYADSELIFRRTGTEKDRVASVNYCSQLKQIMKQKSDIVSSYIRVGHANAHGWRKGGATHATSGTTCPPPITSVARRGEWSMGKVLDVYWHCAEPGDNYLGRVMACLNPLLPSFKILPPHFKMVNPCDNKNISEAMTLMYGPILDRWVDTPQDPTGVLLRLLATIVHHFEWIQSMAYFSTDHPFNSIPLTFKPDLVAELKELITTETSPVIDEATGIPPHVEHSFRLHKLVEVSNECLQLLRNQIFDVKKVNTYFDHKTFEILLKKRIHVLLKFTGCT